jgi:hypothetical protein
MYGFQPCKVNDVVMVSPYSDSVSYLTRLWGRGTFGRDTINAIYNSPHCSVGDWKTLICGYDYQRFGRLESFNWRERRLESCLRHRPWSDWVTPECTIYKPFKLPALISETESLYWSKQKFENNSCDASTSVTFYTYSETKGVEIYEQKHEKIIERDSCGLAILPRRINVPETFCFQGRLC